ncbi:FAD-linked oxidase C-terminal domain-containing protein [Bradyrhizobium sp. Gha]|uniref:FAD-linked oxidase C-terminal domain-containing protein n=1 Tax=Bradyrhizobium sp. Gha TaxID=1855318 RepID=UPI000B881340|nr:FAD-linked oxidase C-terminal domain-containing protein [Bradyrhizobium sp. Gha]
MTLRHFRYAWNWPRWWHDRDPVGRPFQAKGRHGALAEQWLEIKSRAFDEVITHGGTVTRHHALGRDHMPWYRRQRPDLFASLLQAAKDPRRIRRDF